MNIKIGFYDKMPKATECPIMTKCPKSICPNDILPNHDKMPKLIKCPKDILPKMTICPKSHFAQGDKLPKLSLWQSAIFVTNISADNWYIGHTDYWYLLVIDKGANRGWRNQPEFQDFLLRDTQYMLWNSGWAKKQPVAWHGGTGYMGTLGYWSIHQGYKIAQKFFCSYVIPKEYIKEIC